MKQILILTFILVAISLSAQVQICSDGDATLTASGGVNYLWSNAATTPSITVTTAGTYSVTVSNGVVGDNPACDDVQSIVVTQCTAIAAGSSSTDNTSCTAPYNGTATVTPTGGCGTGYTIIWNTSPTQTGATATGLQNGSYTATIVSTTSSGCDCDFDITVIVDNDITAPVANINGQCN